MRAGLELVAAVGALKTHAPLQTRVGIATGLVVVGDLIGSGASQEQAIVGGRQTSQRACRARFKTVVAGYFGSALHLADDWIKRAVGVPSPMYFATKPPKRCTVSATRF